MDFTSFFIKSQSFFITFQYPYSDILLYLANIAISTYGVILAGDFAVDLTLSCRAGRKMFREYESLRALVILLAILAVAQPLKIAVGAPL